MSFFKNFPYTTYEFGTNSVLTNIIDLFRYVHVTDNILDDANSYRFYQIQDGERPDVVSYKLYGTPDYYWTFFIANDSLHEGLSGWPLSTQEFEEYMKREYEGVVITGRPIIVRDSDGLIIDHRNSIANRFKLGERIRGLTSGATGVIVEKNSRYNSLTLEDVDGIFQENEIVAGAVTVDSITTYKVYGRQLAPKYYVNINGNEVDHSVYIQGGFDVNQIDIITNREWETEMNDKRASIRVIRPEFIEGFTSKYKRLIRQ